MSFHNNVNDEKIECLLFSWDPRVWILLFKPKSFNACFCLNWPLNIDRNHCSLIISWQHFLFSQKLLQTSVKFCVYCAAWEFCNLKRELYIPTNLQWYANWAWIEIHFRNCCQGTEYVSVYNHGQNLLRHMKITNPFPWWILLSSQVKGSLSFPLFQFWKRLNIHKVFCKIVWAGRGWLQMKKMFSFKYKILMLVQKC